MRRSAPPTRARLRASTLRAEANTAREAFDAWERGGRDLEDPRYEALGKAFEAAEARAQAAERREAERPGQRKREKKAQVRRVVAEAKSGTSIRKSADASALARVACCRGRDCHRTVELRGDPGRLWSAGWGSCWVAEGTPPGTLVRAWWCPACWVPPRLTAADPDGGTDVRGYTAADGPVLVHAAPRGRLSARAESDATRRRDSRARLRLEGDLQRLAEIDPPKAEAALQRLIYTAPSKHVGRAWRALAAKVAGT